MHILIAIFTGLAALAGWYLRVKAISTAARDVSKFAKRARNAPRKIAFTHRANKTGLKGVKDPMEAGSILLVLMAGVRTNVALVAPYKGVIKSEIQTVFELEEVETGDLITHAVWMVRDVELVSGVFIRMVDIIRRASGIGPTELVDLYEMLQRVSAADGKVSSEQAHMLGLYRNKTGMQV